MASALRRGVHFSRPPRSLTITASSAPIASESTRQGVSTYGTTESIPASISSARSTGAAAMSVRQNRFNWARGMNHTTIGQSR